MLELIKATVRNVMGLLGSGGATSVGTGPAASAKDAGSAAAARDNAQATSGDHSPIIGTQNNYASPADPLSALDWWDHPDAPDFQMSPGIEALPDQSGFKLLMGFYMKRGKAGRPSVKWIGAGIDAAAAWTLMDENRPNKYTVKGPAVTPTTDSEEYDFEVSFRWIDGAIHGCAWKWTVARRDDRRWNMSNDAANTGRPYRSW